MELYIHTGKSWSALWMCEPESLPAGEGEATCWVGALSSLALHILSHCLWCPKSYQDEELHQTTTCGDCWYVELLWCVCLRESEREREREREDISPHIFNLYSTTTVGYAWLPLMDSKGRVSSGTHNLAVSASLPSGYLGLTPSSPRSGVRKKN